MRTAIAAILVVFLAGCSVTKEPTPNLHGPMTHVVVCWLKQPRNGLDASELIAASRQFRRLPGVTGVSVGLQRSVATTRPIDDTTFDVLIVMSFDSPESLRAYQNSPAHQRAVKDVLQPLTRKVLVYDASEP